MWRTSKPDETILDPIRAAWYRLIGTAASVFYPLIFFPARRTCQRHLFLFPAFAPVDSRAGRESDHGQVRQ
jgi:hypothetical protein